MPPTKANSGSQLCRLQRGSILCIGIPLLDIIFFGDKQFLSKFGLNANDACVVDEQRFVAVYKALKRRYKAENQIAGGSCQNVARTAQWLLGDDCQGTVTYMGAIGVDKSGALLKQKAEEDGVNCIYQIIRDVPTGTCLAVLNDKDRSLLAHLGAASHFTYAHIEENWQAVEDAQLIYIEGFFINTCFEACMTLARHAAEHSEKKFLLNLSAEFVVVEYKEQLQQIMPYVDVLLGNGAEALSFAKEFGLRTSNLHEIVKQIADMEKKRPEVERIVVVTQGPHPVIYATSKMTVSQQYEVPILPSKQIVDTTGAGDAFVGGLLAKMCKDGTESLEECIRSGSNTSAIVIQQLGCTFPAERPRLERQCANQ